MDIAHVVLLVLHIAGIVALLAGILVQVRRPEKRVNGLMRDGVGTAFLAGLFLVGVLEAGDDPVDHTKIAVKFAIGLVLLVLVMANLRKEWIPARPLLGAARAHPRQRRRRALWTLASTAPVRAGRARPLRGSRDGRSAPARPAGCGGGGT